MDFDRILSLFLGLIVLSSGQETTEENTKSPQPVISMILLPDLPKVTAISESEINSLKPESDFEDQPMLPQMNLEENSSPVFQDTRSEGHREMVMYAANQAEMAQVGGPSREMDDDRNDLLDALEIEECGEVTCKTPFKQRITSWLCEYTKYTAESVAWIEKFELWWAGCEESDETRSVWVDGSKECPDNDMIKCSMPEKRRCAYDRMGCTRCICTDGSYADSALVFKMWRKEMAMFKKRFQVYKSHAETCTRVNMNDMCTDDADESSGSGDMGSGDVDMGSGDMDYGSGSEEELSDRSGSGDEPNYDDVGASGSESGSGGEPCAMESGCGGSGKTDDEETQIGEMPSDQDQQQQQQPPPQ